MSTSKSRTRPARLETELPESKPAHATQQNQFAAAVGAIAKRYGVKVGSASMPEKNPYAMTTEQAVKVARQAGIITQAGNLTRTFK